MSYTTEKQEPPSAPSPLNGASSLGHCPGGRWTFDESVTDVFDDMLARSIPDLETMRSIVTRTAARFVVPGAHILDLGCSLGAAMAPLVALFGATNTFVGVEASVPMVETCRRRFSEAIEAGRVEIRAGDLRDGVPDVRTCVTLCVLSLMFTPIEHRFRVLTEIYDHTLPGGALILVEKVLGIDVVADTTLTALYHDHKREMGYTKEEIDRKRLSLEGVLVPVTAAWNEQMLRGARFEHVECIWRCLNFAAWLAVKA